MSMGYALREQYPIDEDCKPIEKYGELGLFRAHEIPKIVPIVVDKPGLDVACGAIGIGEITSIPTAPAIADAYFRYDGERRTKLPLANTPYERRGSKMAVKNASPIRRPLSPAMAAAAPRQSASTAASAASCA